MIVNLSQWYVNVASDAARTIGAGVCVIADRQASNTVLDQKVSFATSDGRRALVNWRWYRSADQIPSWFEDFTGTSRTAIDSSETARAEFLGFLGDHFPHSPLMAPSGPVNDPARSMAFARELVRVRDAAFTGREVYASVSVDRQGIQDPAVLSQMTMPVGATGIFLTVLDSATYPSAWTSSEWAAWLRLVGGLQRAGHTVILDCADARGVVALGIADVEFTTGTSQADRQAPLDPGGGGGAGATAPISYFSAPLLVIMHGEALAVDPAGRAAAENHSACGTFGSLPFAGAAPSFDANWLATGEGVGGQTSRRLQRHFQDLYVVEQWIRGQTNRVDAVEQLLVHAQSVGSTLGQHVFKSAASRGELSARLTGYQQARATLGI